MPVSDEDVAQRQEEILALRAERDQAKTEAETAFKSRDNEITMAKWDIEEDALKAEIEYYQNQVSGDKVDAAVEAQIDAIQGVVPEALPSDIADMNKAQLQQYASSVGVTVSPSMTKDEMIAAIQAGKE